MALSFLLMYRFAAAMMVLIIGVHSATAQLVHFRNRFWINLHHYLYAEALSESDRASERLRSSARDAIQHAPCKIPDPQSAAWNRAVAFYASNYIQKDWLFDNEMRKLNDAMGEMNDDSIAASAIPDDLRTVLVGAATVYRTACWPAQQRTNARWIAAENVRIEQHGSAIARKLQAVYEAKWPAYLVADAVAYSNWAGAYTYDSHITVDSVNPDYQDDSALEMIFHEASHALDTKLFDEFAAAFKRRGSDLPRQFDHALIFYTAGAITKQELARTNPSYVPYGERLGIFNRVAGWSADEAVFETDWKPYLQGNKTRSQAIQDVANDVCCRR